MRRGRNNCRSLFFPALSPPILDTPLPNFCPEFSAQQRQQLSFLSPPLRSLLPLDHPVSPPARRLCPELQQRNRSLSAVLSFSDATALSPRRALDRPAVGVGPASFFVARSRFTPRTRTSAPNVRARPPVQSGGSSCAVSEHVSPPWGGKYGFQTFIPGASRPFSCEATLAHSE